MTKTKIKISIEQHKFPVAITGFSLEAEEIFKGELCQRSLFSTKKMTLTSVSNLLKQKGLNLLNIKTKNRNSRLPENHFQYSDSSLVYSPKCIEVCVNEKGGPSRVRFHQGWKKVKDVLNQWKIEWEWWEESPVSRQYFEVLLENNARKRLFKDELTACWYEQTGFSS
jgi:hypothetical protein